MNYGGNDTNSRLKHVFELLINRSEHCKNGQPLIINCCELFLLDSATLHNAGNQTGKFCCTEIGIIK